MANELTTTRIDVPAFQAVRVSKPNKKGISTTKTRGMLGVLTSGNKAEHGAAAENLALQLWADHKYGELVGEYLRVFPKLSGEIKARNDGIATFMQENPEVVVKAKIIDTSNLNKASAIAAINIAHRGIDVKTVKGEQALFMKIGMGVAAAESALQERLKALAAPATETTTA